MAAGITARSYVNNCVFTAKTKYIKIPANSGPHVGEAEDLIAHITTLAGFFPSSVLLSNNSLGSKTIYIRDEASKAAANTLQGIAISHLGSMFIPLVGVPTGGLYIENDDPVYALCFE